MKQRSVPLKDVLAHELKSDEFRLAYEGRRFHLQIAHLVTDLRTRRKFTQAELARRAGVSQPMIARLERGDGRRMPTLDTVSRLLKALGYNFSLHLEPEKSRRAA
jgi:DNA-binding XRE family transcriptional regulator